METILSGLTLVLAFLVMVVWYGALLVGGGKIPTPKK